MVIIDSHAHVNYLNNSDIADKTVQSFCNAGGKAIVDVSTGINELQRSLKLAARHNEIFSSFGIHPERIHRQPEITLQSLIEEFSEGLALCATDNKFVGIGETGYDIYEATGVEQEILENQDLLFKEHIDAANRLSKPITLHIRDRDIARGELYKHAIAFIKKQGTNIPFYFHSFGGQENILPLINDVDGYIGVNGIISYKSAAALQTLVKEIPRDRLLLETDSPYLIPSNAIRERFQDKKVNEPLSIFWIASLVAKYRQEKVEEVLDYTAANAERLFKLL